MLGLPKNFSENIRNDVHYCCLSTLEIEDMRRLPARQKMWAWMTKSLKGTRATVGPYHYLVDEVKAYDIEAVFKRLVGVLEQKLLSAPSMMSSKKYLCFRSIKTKCV